MAEPGWYNAQGDPPGSQRYWDGNDWVGDPVFEPAPAPTAMPGPPLPPGPPPFPVPSPGGYTYAGGQHVAPRRFSTALKTVAIVVSVLKAIPLVFGLIVAIIVAAVSSSIDDQFDDVGLGLDSLVGAAIAVLVVFLLVGALLLGLQFVGALQERPLMVFVPALIMSLFDVLVTIGSWSGWNEARGSTFNNESPAGPVLMTAVAAAQIYIAVQAIRANGDHPEATAREATI